MSSLLKLKKFVSMLLLTVGNLYRVDRGLKNYRF